MRDFINSLLRSKPENQTSNEFPEGVVQAAATRQRAASDNLLATITEFFDVNDEYRRRQGKHHDPAH